MVQVSIIRGVGERIRTIKSSVDRVGFMITQAKNAKKAVEIAEVINSIVKISCQHEGGE